MDCPVDEKSQALIDAEMLRLAIEDLTEKRVAVVSYKPKSKRRNLGLAFRSAARWVFAGGTDKEYVFTFQACCDRLKLSADAVRERLRETLTEDQKRRIRAYMKWRKARGKHAWAGSAL